MSVGIFWARHRAQIRHQEVKLVRVVGLLGIGASSEAEPVSLCCVVVALRRLTWV